MEVSAFMQQVYAVCRRLEDESKNAGVLGGLICDMNFLNFWNLIRNYKNKQKAATANVIPCAYMSQSILKLHVERTVLALDRLFTTCNCSGITLHPALAQAFFNLNVDLRGRCQASWKSLSNGRRQSMQILKTLCDVYQNLAAEGLIDTRTKAFLKFTFPPCRTETIINMLQCVKNDDGHRSSKNLECLKPSSRAPHCGLLSQMTGSTCFAVPEVLLVGLTGEGMVNRDISDVSWYIRYPEELIKMEYFAYLQKYCTQEALTAEQSMQQNSAGTFTGQTGQLTASMIATTSGTAGLHIQPVVQGVPQTQILVQPMLHGQFVQDTTHFGTAPANQYTRPEVIYSQNAASATPLTASSTTVSYPILAPLPSLTPQPITLAQPMLQAQTTPRKATCKRKHTAKRHSDEKPEQRKKQQKTASEIKSEVDAKPENLSQCSSEGTQPSCEPSTAGPSADEDSETQLLDSILRSVFGLSGSEELPKDDNSDVATDSLSMPAQDTPATSSLHASGYPQPEMSGGSYDDLYDLQELRLEDLFFE
ncbi:hypothetical protein KM481_gp44 [Harp seal herpesvirus]|uniref:Uncharacterized protein n=1 Tax=phocid gammaherpesvirus 3 TaxID=2560643 RepID=A0A0R5Z2U8_9GAMA|nr:hypothetical protein KM481_gp44 [Harp seal herpesvirus]AJG42974.1 hypothetical protein [Harp seal herpesvirus]